MNNASSTDNKSSEIDIELRENEIIEDVASTEPGCYSFMKLCTSLPIFNCSLILAFQFVETTGHLYQKVFLCNHAFIKTSMLIFQWNSREL